jgi:hypothetical protein
MKPGAIFGVSDVQSSQSSHQGTAIFRRFLFFAQDFPTFDLREFIHSEKEPSCAYHESRCVGQRFNMADLQ